MILSIKTFSRILKKGTSSRILLKNISRILIKEDIVIVKKHTNTSGCDNNNNKRDISIASEDAESNSETQIIAYQQDA